MLDVKRCARQGIARHLPELVTQLIRQRVSVLRDEFSVGLLPVNRL